MKKIILVTLLITAFFCVSKAQYSNLHIFFNTPDGNIPTGSLISDGTFLYGMTSSGGTANYGTIFKIKADGTGYVKLFNFAGTSNGQSPTGSLIYDGTFLYGMTQNGGTNNIGTIFKIKPDGTGYFKLLNFNDSNGHSPRGSLLFDGTYLYGMTNAGGANLKGLIFKIKPDGTGYFKLYDFDGTNGKNPTGSLISDGTFLYGMTSRGGPFDFGVIFKIKPDGTGYSLLTNFATAGYGIQPVGSLISDGTYLYGMLYGGGPGGWGSVFKIKPDGTGFAGLLAFSGPNGGYPKGDLISDGTYLYGMTTGGGTGSCTDGCGVIFKIKHDGTGYSKLYDYTDALNGGAPSGSLISDGTFLYGMTTSGGSYGIGTIFKYQYCTPFTFTQYPTVCAGQSVTVGSNNYATSGTYTDAFTSLVNGCDSIVTTNLTVLFSSGVSTSQTLTICGGESVTVGRDTYTTSGIYNYTFLGNSCDSTVNTNLTVLPDNTFTQSLIICQGQSITIDSNTYSVNGTYLDTLISYQGCDSLITTTLSVSNVVVNSPSICQGQTAVLTAATTIAGGAYLWNTGDTTQSITITPASTTTYSVSYSVMGCNSIAAGTVTVNAIPIITASASSINVCAGNSVTLTGGGATTYTWTGGVNNGVSFIPSANNTYTVTGTDVNSCSNTATITVNVNSNPLPSVTATVSNDTICIGTSVVFAGGGATSYTWTGGVLNSVSIVPSATNTYTVTGTDTNNCYNTATVTVNVNALPNVTITASATNVCQGSPVTLTGNGAVSYAWSGGVVNGVSFIPSSTATYTLTGTSANNCSKTVTKTINVITSVTPPLIEGFEGIFVPTGWSISNPNANLTWIKKSGVGGFGMSNSSVFMDNFNATASGEKDLLRTVRLDLSAAATATLKFDVAYARYNSSFFDSLNVYVSTNCGISKVKIYGKGSTALATAADNSLSLFVPTAAQWRTETVSLASFVGQPSVEFTFENKSGWGQALYLDNINVTQTIASAGVSISQTTGTNPLCLGSAATFAATPVNGGATPTYQWTVNGSNVGANSPVYSSTSLANNDTVKCTMVSSIAGVSNNPAISNHILMTVNALPSNPVISSNGSTIFCQGDSVTLTSSAANSYLWSNGFTTQSITVLTSQIDSVKVTDVNGCSATSIPIIVTVNPLPAAIINTNGPTSFCQGDSVTLTSSSAISYLWSNGSTTQSITVLTSQIDSVKVTDANGCSSASIPTSVTVNPLPIPAITANGPTNICQGDSVILTASSASSYLWSNGATSQSITISSSESDSVAVTDLNGCIGTSTGINVSLNPIPVLTITDPATVCSPATIDISSSTVTAGSASGDLSYWQDPAATISSPNTITTSGTYFIKLDDGTCSDIKPVNVNINTDCVWPGDANKDLLVDNYDLLPIGLFYSQTGTPRASISNLWQAELSSNWGTIQTNGVDIKHVDCNGDGIIDNNDTLAINQNFSSTHALALYDHLTYARSTDPDLYIVTSNNSYNGGDWVDAEVWTGNSTKQVSNLYGIAFNLSYDASLVEPGTESLTYPNSWLATPGTNAIKIAKIDASQETAFGGITRIDHNNANGFGKIADFKFQAKSSIASPSVFHLSVSTYLAIDSVGIPQVFNPPVDSITLYPMFTGIASEINTASEITIAPNPFTEQTTIVFTEAQKNTTVKIMDVLGKEIKTINFTGKQLVIEKEEMRKGVYFIQIIDENKKVINKKVVLQ